MLAALPRPTETYLLGLDQTTLMSTWRAGVGVWQDFSDIGLPLFCSMRESNICASLSLEVALKDISPIYFIVAQPKSWSWNELRLSFQVGCRSRCSTWERERKKASRIRLVSGSHLSWNREKNCTLVIDLTADEFAVNVQELCYPATRSFTILAHNHRRTLVLSL